MKIQCTHPVRAHVLADFLRRHDMPAMVVDEMDTVLGYGIVPTSVFLPDSFREEAMELIQAEKLELPDDPEFVYEDGVEPQKIGPIEFIWGGQKLMMVTIYVIIAAVAIATFAVIGTLLGWKMFGG